MVEEAAEWAANRIQEGEKAIDEVERLIIELAEERQRCSDVAYNRLMTMGYQLRADDISEDILAEAVRG